MTEIDCGLVYVRRSFIRKGEQAISPERQLDNCKRICEERGWIAEVYQDADEGVHYSGRSEDHRPGWLQLKQQIGRGDVVAVVVDSLDRACRSTRDFVLFLKLLEDHDVALISRKENLDTQSAFGRAMVTILMVFAELEANLAAERVTDTVSYLKRKGVHWGYTPYGYQRGDDLILIPSNDGVDEEHPDRHAVMKIMECYATGDHSYKSLARHINTLGYRFLNRQGERVPFTRYNVRSIISNVLIYLGYIPIGRGKDMMVLPLDPNSDPVEQVIEMTHAVPGQHEPLISRDLAVRVLRARRKRVDLRVIRDRRCYILTPALHCAECGAPLRGQARPHGPGHYYRHYRQSCGAPPHDAPTVEQGFLDLLDGFTIPPVLADRVRERVRERLELRPENKELQLAIGRLQSQLTRLKNLYVVGDISWDEYRSQKTALGEDLARYRAKLGPGDYNVDSVLSQLHNLTGILRCGTSGQQKKAINAFLDRIEIDADGQIVKVVPAEWARLLIGDLRIAIRDMVCPQGMSSAQHVTLCHFLSLAA